MKFNKIESKIQQNVLSKKLSKKPLNRFPKKGLSFYKIKINKNRVAFLFIIIIKYFI
jgi:hypothetical protein